MKTIKKESAVNKGLLGRMVAKYSKDSANLKITGPILGMIVQVLNDEYWPIRIEWYTQEGPVCANYPQDIVESLLLSYKDIKSKL